MDELKAAIAYFEDAVKEFDEVIADCSEALQTELAEQEQHFVVALEVMRRTQPESKQIDTLKKALETEKCALLSACMVFQELLDCENPLPICKGCEPDDDCVLHLLDYFRQQAQEQEGKR